MTEGPIPESPPRRRPRGTLRLAAGALIAAVLLIAASLFRSGAESIGKLGDMEFNLTEERVREVVSTTLQREAEEAFLVTGRLDVVATTEVSNTRTVLPGILNMSLGTSSATVRVPGRIYYGVDLREFEASQVELVGDSLVRIRIPGPRVKAAEPRMADMEVRTERGWARIPGHSDREAERRAVQLVQPALYRQGRAHLADALQPRVNTAAALERLLRPALDAAGAVGATYHITVGSTTFTSSGDRTATPVR